MQKFLFFIPLLWIFVFLFHKKISKFFFLIIVDVIILTLLFILKTNNVIIILLLMFLINFLTLLLPEEDIGFKKQDMLFIISLIFVLPVFFFIKKYNNVFLARPSINEKLQLILLFFLFTITCFFVLKGILIKTDEKK